MLLRWCKYLWSIRSKVTHTHRLSDHFQSSNAPWHWSNGQQLCPANSSYLICCICCANSISHWCPRNMKWMALLAITFLHCKDVLIWAKPCLRKMPTLPNLLTNNIGVGFCVFSPWSIKVLPVCIVSSKFSYFCSRTWQDVTIAELWCEENGFVGLKVAC